MATTTPNFGWAVPTSTDLVKDGAVAIETLGDSIDASLVDLKGGTTGQVLKKNTNTDMDFVWGSAGASPLTTKGDVYTYSTADARLAVGANDTVLTADSSTATGLKWAAPAGGGANWTLVGTGTTTSGSTVTVSGITGADKLFIMLKNISTNTASDYIYFRINTTSANYNWSGSEYLINSTYSANNFGCYTDSGDHIPLAFLSGSATSRCNGFIMITGGNSSGVKSIQTVAATNAATSNTQIHYNGGGFWNNSATITSVSILCNNTFDAGSFEVYKSA
jgi:hypothetical protein